MTKKIAAKRYKLAYAELAPIRSNMVWITREYQMSCLIGYASI